MKRKYFEDYNAPNNYYKKLHQNARSRMRRRAADSSPTGFSSYSPTGGEYHGNTPSKAVAIASGAELGFITGNVPGAVLGGVAAAKAYDFMQTDPVSFSKKDISMGKFYGKFPKGRRNKPLVSDKGYSLKTETYGRIEDPQALYIGHTTWDFGPMALTMIGAMVRKLFLKAGIAVNDKYMELPLRNTTSSTGFQIDVSVMHALTGVISELTTYTVIENNTITEVVNGLGGLKTFLDQRFCDDAVAKPFNLCAICLYEVLPTTGEHRLRSRLDLNNEMVHMAVSSHLTLQNRTAGDNATVAERNQIDRIDNQPLKGKVYQFQGGDPRLRTFAAAATKINMAPQGGAILVRAGQLPSTDFQNPPPGNYWKNSTKSANVKLPVGGIKTSTVYSKHKNNCNTFLDKMRAVVTGTTDAFYVSQVPGVCEMFGLEEELRTAGANHVTVQYQRTYTVFCHFTTQRIPPLKPIFLSVEKNNLIV